MHCCPWAGGKSCKEHKATATDKGSNYADGALMAAKAVDPEVACEEHCLFCFSVLHSHLTGAPSPVPAFPNGYCALFVTWNTSSGQQGHWKLRGCIGTLEPKQLHSALHDYALTSALRDHRFSPIKLKELPSLQCKVSLLSRFERAASWCDWQVGVHGVIVQFTDPQMHCKRQATFLPDVASEHGWDHQQCIDSAIKKAGFSGVITQQLRESVTVERYQSTIASVSYDDYQRALEDAAGMAADSRAPALHVMA